MRKKRNEFYAAGHVVGYTVAMPSSNTLSRVVAGLVKWSDTLAMNAKIIPVLLAMASPLLCAESWRAWAEKPDAPFTARFEPYADTRERTFLRDSVSCYSDLHKFTPYPGSLVIEAAANRDGAAPTQGDPLDVTIEVVQIKNENAGFPVVPANGHYAENPFLPFSFPSGRAGRPVAVISARMSAPGDGGAVRIPLSMPRHGAYNTSLRIRWRVFAKGDGGILAQGVLPMAFWDGTSDFFMGKYSPYVETRPRMLEKDGKGTSALATDALWDAWPMLASSFDEVWFDAAGFERAFGAESGRDASQFANRARLLGLVLCAAKDDAAAWDALSASGASRWRDIVCPMPSRRAYSGKFGEKLGDSFSSYSYSNPKTKEEIIRLIEDAERKLEGARIPGDTLGREQWPYTVATTLFLSVFAIGSVAILVRYFAFRSGEARLAVWHVLPVWAVTCMVFGFLALPMFLDRTPRLDVTEWRFGIDGVPEALCIANGRAHSFLAVPALWTIHSDAWFFKDYYFGDLFDDGTGPCEFSIAPDGRCSVSSPLAKRGMGESASAARFVRHESPVALSPDPEAASAMTNAEAETKLLMAWTSPATLPPDVDAVHTPDRSVTALEDLDAVFVYTRNRWYSLGPMKAGDTVALDVSQRVWIKMDTRSKPWKDLFAAAPFAIYDADVKSYAESRLAMGKENGEEPDKGEPANRDADVEGGIGIAGAEAQFQSTERTEAMKRKLGAAFVVAIRGGTGGDPCLSAGFPGGRAAKVSGRIVNLEVFP